MFTVISIIVFIICIILILAVLVQNSKGGGLAANFTGSQVMGVRRTADFLERATWWLAGSLLALSILANIVLPRQTAEQKESLIKDQIQNAIDPTAVPNFPTNAPAQQGQQQQNQPQQSEQKK
jgi:preprotein translocase subunit SecG